MIIGKNMRHALNFVTNYPKKWHSFSADRATKEAVNKLLKLGLVEINEYHQFRKTK